MLCQRWIVTVAHAVLTPCKVQQLLVLQTYLLTVGLHFELPIKDNTSPAVVTPIGWLWEEPLEFSSMTDLSIVWETRLSTAVAQGP